jgi:hypothetical protein
MTRVFGHVTGVPVGTHFANGRSDGTRVELFLAGAARLDWAVVERILAA